jgi:hypothetical protein
MQMVKESLDEGYCDISGRVGDLDFVGMSLHFFVPLLSHSSVSQVTWGM